MPVSPSSDNYTLGRGIIYFDKKDSTTSLYEGERDMGNANSVTVNVAIDTRDHFSNRSGLKAKDKKVVLQITPTIAFTLDEINYENVQLVFMADRTDVSQTADDALTSLLDVSAYNGGALKGNRYYSVGAYRNIGVYKLPYDGGAVALAARGETITGTTSGATCVVLNLVPGSVQASGTMYVRTIGGTPPFQDNEPITSSGTMTGVVNCPTTTTGFDVTSGLVFDTTDVAISDDATNAVILTKTTDYTVDSATGRIKTVVGGAMDGLAADYDVEFAVKALSYKRIQAFNETSIEGRLRFVPDNPVGNDMELFIHRCDLTPEGDVQMISDEWTALSFTGEILKDETSNPLSPYMNVITTDV